MVERGDFPNPFIPWFPDKKFSFNSSTRFDHSLFYVGPRGSGTQFHVHGAAWNALIYGEKRWVRQQCHVLKL